MVRAKKIPGFHMEHISASTRSVPKKHSLALQVLEGKRLSTNHLHLSLVNIHRKSGKPVMEVSASLPKGNIQ